MFDKLEEINRKPEAFDLYTAESLWADEYRSKNMLAFHLDEIIDVSSRNIEFIDRSSSWIVDHFQLGPGKAVCDAGCGPGLYASRLARSGAEITGLDFSENSIRYAEEQAVNSKQKINYIHVNYLEFEPRERYDLITMIMCDFCALSSAQRRSLLSKFHEWLKEGGAILLDVYSMDAYAKREESASYEKNHLNQFWCEDDYYCFVNTFKYDDKAVVLDKYSIFQKNGRSETIYNWLQYFSPESLAEEMSEAGFTVREIFRDVAGCAHSDQHPEFAVVITRADSDYSGS